VALVGALIVFIYILFTAVSVPVQDAGSIGIISSSPAGRKDFKFLLVCRTNKADFIEIQRYRKLLTAWHDPCNKQTRATVHFPDLSLRLRLCDGSSGRGFAGVEVSFLLQEHRGKNRVGPHHSQVLAGADNASADEPGFMGRSEAQTRGDDRGRTCQRTLESTSRMIFRETTALQIAISAKKN
jgi:hypothetical protein